jgi:hypothetical protein
MTLVLRTFRSKHGCESTVVAALRNAATRMIQDRQAEAVLICQRSDILNRILWIENRARGVDLRSPTREQEAYLEFLQEASTPYRLIFVDGFYRFPLAPCDVWWLESHQLSHSQPELLQGLLEVTRCATMDAHLVGISLYRAADELTRVIAFLALQPGITPAEYFKEHFPFTSGGDGAARAVGWYPLTVSWTGGRLTADGSSPISPCRYPRTAFWARSSSHVWSGVTPATVQPTNPKEV